MLSFIGWEAVSHLAGELRDPTRQLPRAIFAALVVVVLYLGPAVATVGVLGTAEPSRVPIADLMAAGLGAPGRTATAALALRLTMGTMNAYVAAAVKLTGAPADERSAPVSRPPWPSPPSSSCSPSPGRRCSCRPRSPASIRPSR